MTLTREQKVAVLRPLVDRLCTSHIWLNHRHVDEPCTATRLSEHVMGGAKLGLCPISPGESTTRVALLDMDSHKGEVPWDTMQTAAFDLVGELARRENHARVWRSSGGLGIHIILTWAKPQDAYSVRVMLRNLLEGAALEEGAGGMAKSQVEIFPKQDEVPADGFGNMFVLPFAGKSEPL